MTDQPIDTGLLLDMGAHARKVSDLTEYAYQAVRSPVPHPNTIGDRFETLVDYVDIHVRRDTDRWQGTQRTLPPATTCHLSLDSNTVGFLLRLLREHIITRDDDYRVHADARNTLTHAYQKAEM